MNDDIRHAVEAAREALAGLADVLDHLPLSEDERRRVASAVEGGAGGWLGGPFLADLLERAASNLEADDGHRFDPDGDRCVCGGEWVWYDDEPIGYGCEVAGRPVFPPVDAFGRPVDDEDGR